MAEEVKTLPLRSDIPKEHQWNAESVFENRAAWEVALEKVKADIPTMESYQGRLGESPTVLKEAMDFLDDFYQRFMHIMVYAYMSQASDSTNQENAQLMGMASAVIGPASAAASFIDPELISLGEEKLMGWVKDNEELAYLEHYIENLFRQQEHVRSTEVEEVLGLATDPLRAITQINDMMTNADMEFAPAVDAKGNEHTVAQSTYNDLLTHPDRALRRSAYNSYTDAYLSFKNTMAANLEAAIKRDIFNARARRYDSSLEAALFPDNISPVVFHNLIDTFKKNLPTWHRYWDVRRKALGTDDHQPFDIWAPLTSNPPTVTFEEAVDMIANGVAPLGDEYVAILRRGCLEDRWVDRYPNKGKREGAFSYGAPGMYPIIHMSYVDKMESMSTLAHELGHSMHSYLTWETQPLIYTDYTIFAAEVASNFHQAMTRAHLLETIDDKDFQIAIIEEAMDNIHRYFLIMPTLARFELETHERAEKGQPLNADALIELMADLFGEAYGDTMTYDRERVGITWATFSHLYMNFYVFQYATGISAAHALANRVLAGGSDEAERYLDFLKAGGSEYPIDILKHAGVDMTGPEAVDETFKVLAGYVDKLEELTS